MLYHRFFTERQIVLGNNEKIVRIRQNFYQDESSNKEDESGKLLPYELLVFNFAILVNYSQRRLQILIYNLY